MKTFDEIKAEAMKHFDENFTIATYNNTDKNLFTLGWYRGYMEGMKQAIAELTGVTWRA